MAESQAGSVQRLGRCKVHFSVAKQLAKNETNEKERLRTSCVPKPALIPSRLAHVDFRLGGLQVWGNREMNGA
jgi:hypothetical protein